MALRPGLDTPLDGIPNFLLRIGLTLGIAELSYRYVEMPIRHGVIARLIARYKTGTRDVRSTMKRMGIAIASFTTAGLVVVGVLLATAPAPSAAEALPADVAAAIGIQDGGPTEVSIDSAAGPSSGPSDAASSPSSSDVKKANGTVSVIGDSVVLGARGAITDAIPGAKVDASVARMPGAFVGPMKRLTRNDRLAPIVVVHPGTNGVLPASILRDILNPLKNYQVVLVNSVMPRSWRKSNNATIDDVAKDYPNVTVADWYSISKDHDEWFVSDGIHLTKPGAKAFAELIKQTAGL